MIRLVRDFHEKFSLPLGDTDIFMGDNRRVQEFRINFMREELDEFEEAIQKGDKVEAFDALIDLVYVAMGTALFMGITPDQWDTGMNVVHDCNMAKIAVINADDSKRHSLYDVRKPPGWVGPEDHLRRILGWSS